MILIVIFDQDDEVFGSTAEGKCKDSNAVKVFKKTKRHTLDRNAVHSSITYVSLTNSSVFLLFK